MRTLAAHTLILSQTRKLDFSFPVQNKEEIIFVTVWEDGGLTSLLSWLHTSHFLSLLTKFYFSCVRQDFPSFSAGIFNGMILSSLSFSLNVFGLLGSREKALLKTKQQVESDNLIVMYPHIVVQHSRQSVNLQSTTMPIQNSGLLPRKGGGGGGRYR